MTMRLLRHLAVALTVASAVAALAALAPLSPVASTCAAADSHRAGIVVQHGDGSIVTRCVAFGGDTATAEQLLSRSGIAWSSQTFGGFGAAVCAVDGEPARYVDCPGKDSYWAVFVSRGGTAWQLSAVGVSALELRDGDLAGFRYVPTSGTAPAPALPVGICTTATPALIATRTSGTPAATATAAPTAPAAGASATSPTPDMTPNGATASASSAPPPSAPPSSPDPGLLAAAAVGGALAGLAVLRLAAARRRTP
jgi:hypothetical protein